MSQTITNLKNQILSQGTSGNWSGQGFGSAEANAEDMAKILAGIGITDIRQFGQFEKTVNKNKTVQPEYKYVADSWDSGHNEPTGRYYIPQYNTDGQEIGKTYVDPASVTKKDVSYGDNYEIIYTANVPTTEMVYGNKVTGEAVPITYGERQTGNAWGGTFAGKGNTGYRVQFDSAGNPYFYTTGASSSDFADIAPLLSIAAAVAVPGIGSAIGSAFGASGAAATALGNAVIGGAISEASGGDFLQGALASGAGSLFSGVVNPAVTEAVGSQAVGNALTSGVLSELQGGDFIQGAVQGGISGAINDAKLAAAEDYLQSLPGGYEIDAAPAPTEADVLAAITADQAPIYDASYVPDTSFTPDYSLSTGASGEPSLTVAPITTEYKIGSYDYTLGDLIDSLGLTAPTTPNIDSMGGGQGIILKTNDGYITESGFVPNTYVSSLGDTSSFINKPVIDTGLSYDELKNTSESDLNAKLAVLDVAKALTPVALAALMKSAYDTANSEASDGFAIIPYSKDWKSPTYNMAFTQDTTNLFPDFPAAQKMQSAASRITAPNQYQLSDVINTLNYQSVPFTSTQYQMPAMQQRDMSAYNDIIGGIDGRQMSINDIINSIGKTQTPTFDMSNIVGNVQGSPVSIEDIIAGIQSQYGQTPTSTMG